MNKNSLSQLINENSQKINALYQDLRQSSHNSSATAEFHRRYDQLAFPGGLEREYQLLKEKDENAIFAAIEYLMVDPYYFRSGYIKQKLITLLKKVPLNAQQIKQLEDCIIKKVTKKSGRELIDYARLARYIDNPSLRKRLEHIASTESDQQIISNVRMILTRMQ